MSLKQCHSVYCRYKLESHDDIIEYGYSQPMLIFKYDHIACENKTLC